MVIHSASEPFIALTTDRTTDTYPDYKHEVPLEILDFTGDLQLAFKFEVTTDVNIVQ